MGSYFINADFGSITDTSQLKIPSNPLERVIGQDDAVRIARIAARQRRHLLLVGPPGVGKSMIAQAMSFFIDRPKEEVRVLHNPEYPERPFIEIKTATQIEQEKEELNAAEGILIDPENVSFEISERLGFRCTKCGFLSSYNESICPSCNQQKTSSTGQGPFGDVFNVIGAAFGVQSSPEKVTSTRKNGDHEEVIVYERANDKIRILDERTLEKRRKMDKRSPSKVIIPLNRNTFILATGASETELQERKFPITGRNPQSAGASVRVDNVPANFILVAACNMQDLRYILSPLRSRIVGSGYEILMEVSIPDNPENRLKYLQFIAQEINSDGKIPHMAIEAANLIVEEGKRRAKTIDHRDNALTLRLRELGGLIRASGDLAVSRESKLTEVEDVLEALKTYLPVEEKINKTYGNLGVAMSSENTLSQRDETYYPTFHNYNEDPSYH